MKRKSIQKKSKETPRSINEVDFNLLKTKRKLTEEDKKELNNFIEGLNKTHIDTSDMRETGKVLCDGISAMVDVIALSCKLHTMDLIDLTDIINKPKPKPRNYYKQTSEFYCCKQKLKGVNVCGYHMDFECWEYKCPKCEKTFFIYDHNEYREKRGD